MTDNASMDAPEKKKKKRKFAAHDLYFFYEGNRAVWEGRSRNLANRNEALSNLYGFQIASENGKKILFGVWYLILSVPMLIFSAVEANRLLRSGELSQFLYILFLLAAFTGYMIVTGGVLAWIKQELIELRIRLWSPVLRDILNQGIATVGYVQRTEKHHIVRFQFEDEYGRLQPGTYVSMRRFFVGDNGNAYALNREDTDDVKLPANLIHDSAMWYRKNRVRAAKKIAGNSRWYMVKRPIHNDLSSVRETGKIALLVHEDKLIVL